MAAIPALLPTPARTAHFAILPLVSSEVETPAVMA